MYPSLRIVTNTKQLFVLFVDEIFHSAVERVHYGRSGSGLLRVSSGIINDTCNSRTQYSNDWMRTVVFMHPLLM